MEAGFHTQTVAHCRPAHTLGQIDAATYRLVSHISNSHSLGPSGAHASTIPLRPFPDFLLLIFNWATALPNEDTFGYMPGSIF